VPGLSFHPLQSFANAERAAERASGMAVVRGWAVFERFDRPAGAAFVAERYWWNALPDGKWVDLTPRPEAWPNLLLAEAAQGAPKSQAVLSAPEAQLAARLLGQRFRQAVAGSLAPEPALPAAGTAAARQKAEVKAKPRAQASAASPVKLSPDQGAAPLDYSKWKNIVDSDDEALEEAPARGSRPPPEADYGVKDLAEATPAGKQPPVPDFLVGNTGGGGGTNCFLSICKLLDAAEQKKEGSGDNVHQLAQAFGKIYHCSLHDAKRQRFYREAIAAVPKGAFFVVLGLGSILPMLTVARKGKGVLIEMSTKLASVGEKILKANNLTNFAMVAVPEGLDKEAPIAKAVAQHVPKDAKHVVILTELLAHDMLSNGIVPASVLMHKAVQARATKAEVSHIPKTIELSAAPVEMRSERLNEFDIRPFNAFRHTTSNEKADFWWWAVRMDNQLNTQIGVLGPPKTLCGFDFDRSPEIVLDEVRRNLKFEITSRGRCNGIAMWWTMKYGDQEYSTKPAVAGSAEQEKDKKKPSRPDRSEWKQAIHYLAGETAVFVGDSLEVLASITPRFTVRMLQLSPFSVEAPPWVKAPINSKFSATMPILPYHFLMLTDLERLQVYQDGIRAAVRYQRKRLGRRPRVLDAGCGAGLLGMTAAMEGADVWCCEAVPIMRQMCREVVAVNASAIAEKKGLVQLLPAMMSTRLQVGEDIAEKFDVVVSEVMDLWCLGEGVLPTMRHAHHKLLAEGGSMLPGRLVVFVQPVRAAPVEPGGA